MRFRSLSRALAAVALALFVGGPVTAQSVQGKSVQSFGLVAGHSGWLLASNRLFWTDTLGARWSEITPATSGNVSGVFFRADGNGWLVASSSAALTVAHTTDNGAHWTTQPIATPFTEAQAPNGRASVFFADPQHGFLMLGVQSSSAFRPGILLRTADAGVTWTPAPAPPAGGDLNFLDATHGFMGPGPAGDELYATSDAGSTWQPAALTTPAALSATPSTVALPVFTDATHGALLRTYSTDGAPTTVRYETTDSGATWTVAGNSTAASDLTPIRSSFSTTTAGWAEFGTGACAGAVCTQTTSLRATLDGGQTYFPLAQIPGIDLESNTTIAAPARPATPAAPTPYSSSVYNTSGVMGFDACTLPTVSQMTSWITASPYRVAGIYIGGANFACRSGLGNLTPTYVSTILAQGWQMEALWVGLQAPGSSCSSCSSFSTDTTTANAQGVTEADASVAAMLALGLKQGSTIVYDMEAYSYGVAANTAATKAFLDGWITEVHSKGYIAAVYSSHPEFVNWYPGLVTPAIDIIWFAYFFNSGVACGTACQTVFPSSFDISSAYWLNNHRARQTSSGFNSTYGGVTLNIDEDWIDAPMVTATPNTLTLAKTTGGSVASSTITNSNGDSTAYTAISCGTACTSASATFAPTDTVALVATPSTGLSVSWKGCTSVSGNTCNVTVASSQTVTASFGYPLTVTPAGAGTGTAASSDGNISCGSTCSFAYPTGTTVSLTATAAANSYFTGWTGCSSVLGSTCTVTIGAAAVTVQPTFSTGLSLTVSRAGTGAGTVTSSDGAINCGATCSATYAPGTTVTLTAVATANSAFGGWTGCTSASGAVCTVIISSAQTVTATFAPAPSFTAGVSSSSLSVSPGATGTDTLNLITANGWTGTFSSFACSGQPATVICTFNPATVTATSNATYPVVLTVSVPANIAAIRSATRSTIVLATLLLPGLLPFAFRRRTRSARTHKLLMLCLGIAALALTQGLTACGSNSSPAAATAPSGPIFSGTVTVSYTATQSNTVPVTNTVPITLTIPR